MAAFGRAKRRVLGACGAPPKYHCSKCCHSKPGRRLNMSRLPTPDLDHALEHVGDAWQALAGTRLFITGGTGFVGKWLIESLLWASDRLNLGVSATVLTRNPDRFRA